MYIKITTGNFTAGSDQSTEQQAQSYFSEHYIDADDTLCQGDIVDLSSVYTPLPEYVRQAMDKAGTFRIVESIDRAFNAPLAAALSSGMTESAVATKALYSAAKAM